MCIGNFNGNGPNDIAIILIEKKNNRKRLVLFEANEFHPTRIKNVIYTPFLFDRVSIGHNVSIITKKAPAVAYGSAPPATQTSASIDPTFDGIVIIDWKHAQGTHI